MGIGVTFSVAEWPTLIGAAVDALAGWRVGPRRVDERQLDDLRREVAVADRDRRARRRLAADEGERDRTQRRRDDGAADAADLAIAECQPRAGRDRRGEA